jgi:hypothetical protein
MIDSGSDVTAISLEFMERHVSDWKTLLVPSDIVIQQATGAPGTGSAVRGTILLPMELTVSPRTMRSVNCIVIQGLNYDALLGADLFQAWNANVDFGTGMLVLSIPSLPADPSEQRTIVRLPLRNIANDGTTNDTDPGVMCQSLYLEHPFVIQGHTEVNLPVTTREQPSSTGQVLTVPFDAAERAEAGLADSPVTYSCSLAPYGVDVDFTCKDAPVEPGLARPRWTDTAEALGKPGMVPLRAWNTSDEAITLPAHVPMAMAHFIPNMQVLNLSAISAAQDGEAFSQPPLRAERGGVHGRMNQGTFEVPSAQGQYVPFVNPDDHPTATPTAAPLDDHRSSVSETCEF